jgi:hypothetical protein
MIWDGNTSAFKFHTGRVIVARKNIIQIGIMVLLVMGIGLGCDSVESIDEINFIMTIEAFPSSLEFEEFSSITVTLTHADKSVSTDGGSVTTGDPTPVTGYIVTFSFIQNVSGAKLTVVNASTDSNGKATAIYQAGDKDGIDIIQARLENGQSVRASVVVGASISTTTTTSSTTTTSTTGTTSTTSTTTTTLFF